MHTKRIFDVVVGSLLALAATPVILVLGAVTAITLRAWPIFTQKRVGRDGAEITVPKLRTLPKEFPAYADKHAVREHQPTGFAAFMRRTHLDELPQLWLVPFGRMSLVGPRPEMPFLSEHIDEHTLSKRNSLRPGCTGLWQISTVAGGHIHENSEYDLHYVLHQSFRLDVWILWRTTLRLLSRHRWAISLDDLPDFASPRTARLAVEVPAAE